MSRILERTASVIALDADGIAADQTLGAAGPLTLISTPVVLSPARRVVIDSDGDDSGVNFTITGTRHGSVITETIVGANADAATSTKLFDEVTSIEADGATDDAVRVGWTAESATSWMHIAGLKGRVVVDVPADATVSYGVEATSENLLRGKEAGYEPATSTLITASTTASADEELLVPWSAIRLVVASQDVPLTLRFVPYTGGR